MMENINNQNLEEIIKSLNSRQIQLIEIMLEYPLKVDSAIWILSDPPTKYPKNINNNLTTRMKNLLYKLEEIGIASQAEDKFVLTEFGQQVGDYLNPKSPEEQPIKEVGDYLNPKSPPEDKFILTELGQQIGDCLKPKLSKEQNIKEVKPSRRELQKQETLKRHLEKSNEYLELYKLGFTYQDIGDRYGVTRERVRQILNKNPAFHEYLKEKELAEALAKEAELIAQKEQEEQAKQKIYEKSIGVLYPERVAELWDYEKNGDLKPEEILAGGNKSIWLKCPIDGHSWQKKANDITTIWSRSGTRGCPKCAGKTKKAQKQPTLIEAYPDFVKQYWDYEKNNQLGIDPEKVTCGSSQKVWFKCPVDGNEWESTIASTVYQQWSKNNAGCRVCNGTDQRKQTGWKKANPVIVDFPEEIAKYWLYEKNNELKLDPNILTTGSKKEAWFKCPIDGYEWQQKISAIAKGSWKKGNSGCPACRGLVAAETTSLIALYPEYIQQYWDYEKNNQLGLYPDKLTKGSNKEVWFKCPIDDYEWKGQINSIVRSSWSVGNSGCTRCNYGWTIEAIRQFVASLEEHIPNLTPAERYKIFEQSGILNTQNKNNLKPIKEIIRGKLSGQKLGSFLRGEEIKETELINDENNNLDGNKELQTVDDDLSHISQHTFHKDTENLEEETTENNDLPKVRIQKSLQFLNSKVVASSDQEAVDFFIASRKNRIWAEVFEDESVVEGLEEFTDEGYGYQVRDQFLDEYYQAKNMQIPQGWEFRINGKITPPNLMQKVAAVRLKNAKRMLNISLTGTGKTIGGILSSRMINANLTIIICPLDTVENWHSEIKEVFPDSKVTTRNFTPYWETVENGHHYIIFNHEMFQQPYTANRIRQLLEKYKIDLIIVDEIHKCKQRNDDPSKRRQMIMGLITNATEINPNLHVLGMSATPIINNLKEGKSLVELVSGIERNDLGEMATTNNCMKLHQAFVTLGIRSRVKPKIKIDRIQIPVDISHLVDEIRDEGKSILKMEQILTRARIPIILEKLQPKTIIYTHYVEGIVDQLKEAIEAKGWTVGFHLGGNKSGFDHFVNGSTDVLIASSAMAVGVDGFQRVCSRLILNIPPWTSAELEQLEGRLNRQGQTSDLLTIIMPVTYGYDHGEHWSWDEGRLARLENKQTIADAAVDGVIPEGQLRSESQAFRDLRKWLERLKIGEQKSIIRSKIFVPLPDDDPIDVQRRYAYYGDFSKMNAKWNSSYSQTNYQRLQENPEEWMQYHTLYQEARKTWQIIPYQETIKWLDQRSNLIVADFGCGEALIAKELASKHTIHSFDFIAINDSVIECDMKNVPLEDNCLDLAIFNLSLMGLNYEDYIIEASRTLKLDGQLWIYETKSRIKNMREFINNLNQAGFTIIKNIDVDPFIHIWAIKSIK